jgi:predicted amidohydrolase
VLAAKKRGAARFTWRIERSPLCRPPQNGYFVALCNRVGADGALAFAGESFVCTPEGTVLARALPGAEHILLADVDLSGTGRSHARRLFFQHRRPELYASWFGPAHGPGGAGL